MIYFYKIKSGDHWFNKNNGRWMLDEEMSEETKCLTSSEIADLLENPKSLWRDVFDRNRAIIVKYEVLKPVISDMWYWNDYKENM